MIIKLIDSKKSKGRIFKLADLYIIRGASYCSLDRYDAAVKDFKDAI
jgi:hypothetical protein